MITHTIRLGPKAVPEGHGHEGRDRKYRDRLQRNEIRIAGPLEGAELVHEHGHR